MQIKTVLALTDLEKDSLTGLQAGYALAARFDANLVVGHVLVPRTLDASNVREFLTKHGFDASAAAIEIEVDADVYSGIDLLLEQAHPDLLVLSSKRRRGFGRLLSTSIPVGLVGETTCPVLALHDDKEATAFSRALVCVDGSSESQRLIDVAGTLLEPGGELIAAMVIEDSRLVIGGLDLGTLDKAILAKAEEAAKRFLAGLKASRSDLKIRTRVTTGDAVDEIRHLRKVEAADLVAIGSGGIGGSSRFFLGKVAEAVVREADVPALVVPTNPARDD